LDRIRRDGIELFYEVMGSGPNVVLVHPFPSCHEFWLPVATRLSSKYHVILPDLRSHGRSGVPDRPALMSDHAQDLDAICRELKIEKAVFVGISIGGYILFEMWRRSPQRIKALVLACTKAPGDTPEARAARLQSAEEALNRGAHHFIDSMIPKLLSETTLRNRKDIEAEARHTMRFMSPQGIAMVQRGMAERPDSVPTLATISAPTLIVAGEEDKLSAIAEAQRMRDSVKGSELAVIPRAGHYAALEAAEDAFRLIRTFCDKNA
jgi:pimeloyl-ACP methyl ester carboxylesterase